MNKQFLYISLFLFQFVSCVSQTPSEQVEQTCKGIFEAIEKLDTTKFISLIGRRSLREINKTEEMVGFDILKFRQLFDSNLEGERPKYVLTSTYNSLGQLRVIVPILAKSEFGVEKSLHINLLFGPPNFVSLDKISGYSLIQNNSDSLDFMPLEYWKGNR